MPVTFSDTELTLTTLARIKDRAGVSVSTYDSRLLQLGLAAEAHVRAFCGRDFVAANYIERVDVPGPIITLEQCPIQYVTRVASRPLVAIDVAYDSDTQSGVYLRTTDTTLVLTERPGGTENILTLADYANVTALATAISGIAGFTATVHNNLGNHDAEWIIGNIGPSHADRQGNASLLIYAGEIPFDVQSREWGQLASRWFVQGNRTLEVRYRAGYTTIPNDVQEAVALMASVMHRRATRDLTLRSESIGDYSYTNHIAKEQADSTFAPDAERLIAHYRRI